MMRPTILTATMMEVTVAYLILSQNNALNAFAITRRLVQLELFILWLEMDIAKMKPTMLNATMMEVTVVYSVQAQIIVHNAYVIPMESSPHLAIPNKIMTTTLTCIG